MRLRLLCAAVVCNVLLAAGAYSGCGGGAGTTGTGGGGGGPVFLSTTTTSSSSTGGFTTSTTASSSTGQGGMLGTGGAGGQGTGGMPGTGGQGGGSNGCTHDDCTVGAALDANCDACTMAVCANDAYCCESVGMWDSTCVGMDVPMYCAGVVCAVDGGMDSGGMDSGEMDSGMDSGGMDGGNGCSHDVCTVGAPLEPGCSACAAAVCAQDAFCCDPAEMWDMTCVGVDVPMYCAANVCAGDGGADSGVDSGGADGGSCPIDHLVISEIRSRGLGGANDEFVELWNPTAAPVTLDSTWTLTGRSTSSGSYTQRWKGNGGTIPAYGHFLIAGTNYAQLPARDQGLSSGITDASSVVLNRAGAVIDAVCYYYDAATLAAFDATYTCEGTPVSNLPHNNGNSAASDADVSIERKPGGAGGNCTDTGDNASDFGSMMPATPQSSASPPTP